jgi:hypothetical protein
VRTQTAHLKKAHNNSAFAKVMGFCKWMYGFLPYLLLTIIIHDVAIGFVNLCKAIIGKHADFS